MECEPLPQREPSRRTDSQSVERPAPFVVQDAPMEVASEEPCSHN